MSEQQPQPRERRLEHDVAWQLYVEWQGDPDDREQFWQTYLGRYASRADFGRSLLADYGAQARIQSLPSWLRRYVTLDATAFAGDLERSGHFHLADDPAGSGTYVFDAHAGQPTTVAAMQQKADNETQ